MKHGLTLHTNFKTKDKDKALLVIIEFKYMPKYNDDLGNIMGSFLYNISSCFIHNSYKKIKPDEFRRFNFSVSHTSVTPSLFWVFREPDEINETNKEEYLQTILIQEIKEAEKNIKELNTNRENIPHLFPSQQVFLVGKPFIKENEENKKLERSNYKECCSEFVESIKKIKHKIEIMEPKLIERNYLNGIDLLNKLKIYNDK